MEGETETESGTGTGMGVGRESRIVEQNPICETEWETERNPKRETERETERNPKRETERETKRNPKRETERRPETGTGNGDRNRYCEREAEGNTAREAEENTAREAEGNTAWEGDKDPSLTKRVVFQNTGCCVPIYSRGVRWPLYTQDRLTTQISIPVRHPPDLYIVLVHFHAIPNPYLCNQASPAAQPIATRLAMLTSFSLPHLGSLASNIPKQLGIR